MNVAIITGASSGMGRYFSLMTPLYFKDVDEIWLIARRKNILEDIATYIDIPCKVLAGDLLAEDIYTKTDDLLKSRNASVKLLVNCAGFGKNGYFEKIEKDNHCMQSSMVSLNCTAVVKMCEVVLKYMHNGSHIINVASGAAFCPQPGFSVYAATKSFVLSFSRSLGAELKNRKIYVTAVCPGPVDTEFFNTAGQITSSVKKLVIAKPDKVVKKALSDSLRKKELSVYGLSMKFSHLASKIIPKRLIMKFF